MLAALVKALAVCGVNAGDICTEVCNIFPLHLHIFKCLQEIISLMAG